MHKNGCHYKWTMWTIYLKNYRSIYCVILVCNTNKYPSIHKRFHIICNISKKLVTKILDETSFAQYFESQLIDRLKRWSCSKLQRSELFLLFVKNNSITTGQQLYFNIIQVTTNFTTLLVYLCKIIQHVSFSKF